MKNYTITKNEIIELEKISNEEAKEFLKSKFKDVFKKELQVGKWYKGIRHNFLVNYQSNDGTNTNYGFWGNSRFKNDIFFGEYWVDECLEATPEEVEEALIAEAKKRGFVEGAKFKSFECGNPARTIGKFQHYGIFDYYYVYNYLTVSTIKSEWENYNSNPQIFDNGKWAEIITEETKVITMDKAVKILSKKYGKQVKIK